MYVAGAAALAWARITVLYRAGWVPPGLDPAVLRRSRFILGAVAAPWLLATGLLNAIAWGLRAGG